MRFKRFPICAVLVGPLVLAQHGAWAQQVLWERLWGQARGEVFLRVLALRDGNFIASGTYPRGSGTARVFPGVFLKFTPAGTTVWTRAGRATYTGQHDLVEAPGGGLVYVAGVLNPGPTPDYADPLFQRWRPSGDTLPARVYRNAAVGDFATQVLPQPGGGWAIGSFRGFSSDQAFSLRYVDSTGTQLGPERRFASSLNSFGTLLAPGPAPGTLVLAGSSSTGGAPPLTVHPLLVQLNAAGDSVRAGQYVLTSGQLQQEEVSNTFNNVLRTADGGYAFTVLIDSAGYKLGALVKANAQFVRQWACVVRSGQPYSALHRGIQVKTVRETADGGFVFLAAAYVASSANSRFDLFRVSAAGRLVRRVAVVSVCSEPVPYDLRLLPDSSAIVVGYCGSDAYLARIGGVAAPLAARPARATRTPTALYPNPAHGVVTLRPAGAAPRDPRLWVVNALGQRVEVRVARAPGAPAEYRADCSSLRAGVYAYTFGDGDTALGAGRLVIY
jgi:hypothetical protein